MSRVRAETCETRLGCVTRAEKWLPCVCEPRVAMLCHVYELRRETRLVAMLCHVYELRRETRLG